MNAFLMGAMTFLCGVVLGVGGLLACQMRGDIKANQGYDGYEKDGESWNW